MPKSNPHPVSPDIQARFAALDQLSLRPQFDAAVAYGLDGGKVAPTASASSPSKEVRATSAAARACRDSSARASAACTCDVSPSTSRRNAACAASHSPRCCSNAVEAVTKSYAVTPVATPATAANARFGEIASRPFARPKAMMAPARNRTSISRWRATARAPKTDPTPMAV